MKVLLLTNLFPRERAPSGGVFIRHRADALRRAGVEVDVLAVMPVRSRALETLMAFVGRRHNGSHDETGTFKEVDVPLTSWQYLRSLRGHYSDPAVKRAAQAVSHAVKLNRYDAIVAHGMYMLPAGSVAAELSATFKVPFSVVLHGSDVNVTMPKRAREYVGTLHRADEVVFVSDALREKARSLGFAGQRSAVIPNGVDTQLFGPATRSQRHAPVVTYVGNLLKIKGADRLPAIFTEVAQAIPSATFVVVGDGPELPEIERRLRGHHVRFVGRLPQNEVASVMADADVLVMPSRSEGWPCVVLEAHACGVPVVATDVGGIGEALGDSDLLVTANHDVVSALAQQVVSVLSGKSPSSEALRARAEQFSWDALARTEKGLLEQMVHRQGRKSLEA